MPEGEQEDCGTNGGEEEGTVLKGDEPRAYTTSVCATKECSCGSSWIQAYSTAVPLDV